MLTASDVNEILADVESIRAEDLPYRWWAEPNHETWLLRVNRDHDIDRANKAAHDELEYLKIQGDFKRVVGAPIGAMEYMLGALTVHCPNVDRYDLTPEGHVAFTSFGTTTICLPVLLRVDRMARDDDEKVSA